MEYDQLLSVEGFLMGTTDKNIKMQKDRYSL
jgi:hypothetical protein